MNDADEWSENHGKSTKQPFPAYLAYLLGPSVGPAREMSRMSIEERLDFTTPERSVSLGPMSSRSVAHRHISRPVGHYVERIT